MKNPVVLLFLGTLLGILPLAAQETYVIKLQPQAGTEYHFKTEVQVIVRDEDGKASMSTLMEHALSSRIKSVSDSSITLVEKIEKIKGNAKSKGVDIKFDTDKPKEGNPTMMEQLSQVVGKNVTSQIKPNGVFISGEPLPGGLIGGSNSGTDFRTISGNARYALEPVKVGDSWTVVDTLNNQGMITTTTTVWTLKSVEGDFAILVCTGQGTMTGSPITAPEAKIRGTLVSEGMAKVELKTGISREAAQRVKGQMELEMDGAKQVMTSETASVSRMVN